jgi:aldehyde dehydrogenase (NAD+)
MSQVSSFNTCQRLFEQQQQQTLRIGQLTIKERQVLLRDFSKALDRHRPALLAALEQDLHKHAFEADLSEFWLLYEEIHFAIRELPFWAKPERVATPLALWGTRSEVVSQPKGQVLILSPWNYPLLLTLMPLVGALAAGNTAIIKPSELAPATAEAMAALIAEVFDPTHVALVQGGAEMAEALLELPFNHIFYTGSPRVGKIVMAAASKHLASVTLELGGKSPIIIDESASVKDAVDKLTVKWLNAGQTCITADYVLVHRSLLEPFTKTLKESLVKNYGAHGVKPDMQPSYGCVITQRHTRRLADMVDDAVSLGATLLHGGDYDTDKRYMGPTVLTGVTDDMQVMQEEIFGPILPVKVFDTLDEVIGYLAHRPKPLALYIFSKKRTSIQKLLANTRAGGTGINNVMLHITNRYLPFGGSNNSGIGHYRGHFSFKAFSEPRAVIRQVVPVNPLKLMAPPYGKFHKRVASMLLWLAKRP